MEHPALDPELTKEILAKTSVDLGPNGITQTDIDYADQNGWEFVARDWGEHWFKKTFYGDNEVIVAQYFGRGQWGWRCLQPDRFPEHPEKGKRQLKSAKPNKQPLHAMARAEIDLEKAHRRGELNWDWD